MDHMVETPVATAFAGTLTGVEASQAKLPGMIGKENSAFFPVINPAFRFMKEAFLMLCYAWHREFFRQPHEPRRGLWVGGPKGVGKTTMIEQFMARLGVPVVTITCNRRVPLSDYVQQMVPDGEGGWIQQKGALAIAMEMGFPVVLNEPSAMDPADLVAMHDVIDRGVLTLENGTVIRAAQGFLVFAADNSMGLGDMTGDHAGVNTMNTATMSRFFKLQVDYLPEDEEVKILADLYPQLDAAGNPLSQGSQVFVPFVKVANMVRAAYRGGQSQVTMGIRELIDWVGVSLYFQDMAKQGQDPAWFGLQRIIVDGQPAGEATALRKHYESTFANQSVPV